LASIYIQGLKDYSIIVTDKDKIIVKGSLKIVAQQLLGMKKLIIVHKSYLVASEKIDVVKEGKIIFEDYSIPIGRMYKKEVEAMLFN
jgi:DNA-binding LytR/AlgR family response regulator